MLQDAKEGGELVHRNYLLFGLDKTMGAAEK